MQILDPLATFVFCIMVARTTIPLLDRVLKIFMEGVPSHIDWEKIHSKFSAIDGVTHVGKILLAMTYY